MIYILTRDLKIVLINKFNLALWEKTILGIYKDFSSAETAKAWYRS